MPLEVSDNLWKLVFPTPVWGPGIKLRLPGLAPVPWLLEPSAVPLLVFSGGDLELP